MARTGVREDGPAAAGDSVPAHRLITEAKSLEAAASFVTEALVKQVAKMLQTPTSEIDTTRFLHSCGIDSLLLSRSPTGP